MPSARRGGSIHHSPVAPLIHLSGIRRTVAIPSTRRTVSSSVVSQLELFMKMSAICRHPRDSAPARERAPNPVGDRAFGRSKWLSHFQIGTRPRPRNLRQTRTRDEHESLLWDSKTGAKEKRSLAIRVANPPVQSDGSQRRRRILSRALPRFWLLSNSHVNSH